MDEVLSPEERIAELDEVLSLERIDSPGDGGEEHAFRGVNQRKPNGILFGGQVLAQCVVAASATVDDSRPIHSFHGYFLRAGKVDRDITFGVEELRDGGSFSARRVQAYQDGVPILSAITSFQTVQSGLEHQATMPTDIPQPEDLDPYGEELAGLDLPLIRGWVLKRPFDVRSVEPNIRVRFSGERSTREHLWVRAVAPVDVDPAKQAAMAAYTADYSMLEPTLRAHGLSWFEDGLRVASLDHAMWWHAPIDFNDWHLFVLDAPAAEGGRALGQGSLFRRDGTLVASIAQQGMVRLKRALPAG